jgi:hypothetical protein
MRGQQVNTISKWLHTKLKHPTGTAIVAATLLIASATAHAELVRLTITGNIFGVSDTLRLLETVLGSVPVVGDSITASWLVDTTDAVETTPGSLPYQGNYSSALLGYSLSGNFSSVQFAPVNGGQVQINAVGSQGVVDSWRINSSAPSAVAGETVAGILNLFAPPFTLTSASPFFVPDSLSQFPGTGGAFNNTVSFGVCSTSGCDQLSANVTSLTVAPATTPAALLAALRIEVMGVGPGKSLANKVAAAQAYYAASDTQATCAMLTGLVNEVRAQSGKKINQQLDAKIIADTQTIESAIGCH